MKYKATVISPNGLNVRVGMSTSTPKIDTLPYQAAIIVGEAIKGHAGIYWWRPLVGQTGYVAEKRVYGDYRYLDIGDEIKPPKHKIVVYPHSKADVEEAVRGDRFAIYEQHIEGVPRWIMSYDPTVANIEITSDDRHQTSPDNDNPLFESFLGLNFRELAYYGLPEIEKIKHTTTQHVSWQLELAKRVGTTVIRFHAPHMNIDNNVAIMRTKTLLDKLEQFGLKAIVVLNDSLDSHFYVHGESDWHREVLGHLNKRYFDYDEYFFYRDFVSMITYKLRDHPAVFAWELGNEYAIHPQPATIVDGERFYDFVRGTARMIKRNSPNKLVTTGLINTNQVKPKSMSQAEYARRLYSIPEIDFGTLHIYQADDLSWHEDITSRIDAKVLQELDKPFIVEEIGALNPDNLHNKAIEWLARGAMGIMPWGVDASPQDVGVGDRKWGISAWQDNLIHGEDILRQLALRMRS